MSSLSKQRIVIVGASIAGVRAAEALRHYGYDGRIALVGAETVLPYHRPPLSKEMLGPEPIPPDELWIQPSQFFAEHDIDLHLGEPARAVDARERTVLLASGARLIFDKLLITTGASPRQLDIPGSRLDGVMYVRTLEDSRALRAELALATNVVVIGAGLLGLEVAAAARGVGREVVVLEQAPFPLRRVFRRELAELVVGLHERRGVTIWRNASVRALDGDTRVRVVLLEDGTRVPADVVVVAIGAEPNTEWLRRSGITISNGIIVNELGQTVVPDIYAAGDVARTYSRFAREHVRFEQYGHAQEQGAAVARTMAGVPQSFAAIPSASTTAYGVRVQSIGIPHTAQELVVRGTPDRMLGFMLEDDHVAGAFAFNRARDFALAKRLVNARMRIPRQLLADDSVSLVELANSDR